MISGNANETQKRSVLSALADSSDSRAKKILESLAADKSTAIRLLASSYLKKNFSEGGPAQTQHEAPSKPSSAVQKDNRHHPQSSSAGHNASSHAQSEAPQPAVQVQPGAGSGESFDASKILNLEFAKFVLFPFVVLIVLGLFSPHVPPFIFLIIYLGMIIAVSLFYDFAIAVITTLGICGIAALLYASNLIVNFRPTGLLLFIFLAVSAFISIVTSDLRLKLQNSKMTVEDFKQQIMQLKKMVDKRRDVEDIQRDMDQISKTKNDLATKSRRMSEMFIQIHEIISSQKTDEIVDRVTKLLTRQIGAKSISVWISNPKFHTMYPVGVSERHIAPQKYMSMNIPTEESTVITKVGLEGGFYTAEDFKHISEHEPFSSEFEIKSEFAASMDAGNKIIGVINCEEVGETFELNDETKKLIKLISDVAAWALKNAGDLELSQRDLQNIKKLSDRDREDKKKIKEIFGRFVSPKVIEEIMSDPSSLALGGKRKMITIFFADIRGFTSMSETLVDKPELVLEVVNRFHSAMTEVIIARGGTIDKYIGDATMALFGAPMAQTAQSDALASIESAMAIKVECVKIREQLIKEGKTAVNVGIGINSGEVIVGMVGSTKMMNYTAIGDAVNTAARIESKAAAGQVIISKATYELVKDFVKVQELDPMTVKGKREPLSVFEVLEVVKH